MEIKKYKVTGTMARGDVKGEFIAQLSSKTIKNNHLKAGQYILITNNVNGRDFQIPAALKKCDHMAEGEIRIDQKIRTAIGAKKGDEVSVSKEKRLNKEKYLRYLRRCFRNQVNLVRVQLATPTDMEIDVCRIPREVMESISIESGDTIKVESQYASISIRALELTQEIMDERKAKLTKMKEYDCLSILNIKRVIGTKSDLPWIFLDRGAREKLAGVEEGQKISVCDPVRIYRSISHSISKKLHMLSLSLLLAIIGGFLSFDIPDLIKLIILGIGILLLLSFTFTEIRKKI